ncbi:MAG: hypothetical protein ACYSX0_07910 [Planctomycetota bacterium]|jgi:serine/threonine protein kinase
MSEERARRVNDLFTLVLEIEPDARGEFLDENCAPETREEIEALLRAHETMGQFLATSALDRVGEIAPEPRPLLQPGDRIAAYQVVRIIGSGGAGTVYEAEQLSPHRTVALKVRPFGASRTKPRSSHASSTPTSRMSTRRAFMKGLHGSRWST